MKKSVFLIFSLLLGIILILESPITPKAQQELVIPFQDHLIIVNKGRQGTVSVFGPKGEMVFEVLTSGPNRVYTLSDQIIIVDENLLRIYGVVGTMHGQAISVEPNVRVFTFLSTFALYQSNTLEFYNSNMDSINIIRTTDASSIELIERSLWIVDSRNRIRRVNENGIIINTFQPQTNAEIPSIINIEFPKLIPSNGNPFIGSLELEDSEEDYALVVFTVIESVNAVGFGFIPTLQGPGLVQFQYSCFVPQFVTLAVQVFDKQGHQSLGKEFSFLCST